MLIPFARTLILYLSIILALRLMGKRQVGEMQPSELVVTILVSAVASVPMQDEGIPLLSGLIPILVVLAIELLLSVLVYHSVPMRRFFCGKPVVLMHDGKLEQQNLRKTRVTPDELTEFLRLQGVTDLTTVQYAILETNGSISTLLYSKHQPATAKDAGVHVDELQLPVTLISGGRLLHENLRLAGRTEAWVKEQLSHHHCAVRDVFLLTAEPSGRLYLSIRREADQ